MKARVLLYCPTYKVDGIEQIKPETRKAISDLEFDGELVKEIVSESEYPPPNYENVLVHYQKARQKVLDEGYDALLTVEHDIIVPKDGLQKLWDMDVPVAYGIYLFRGSGNVVNAFRMVSAPAPDMSLTAFKELLAEALEKEIVEVSGCGNGCTLIRREVLEQINFRRTKDDNPIPDMPFATDCLKAGIKQFAHFGVRCGHVLDNGTIWLNTENNGINMTKVTVVKSFVGSDNVSYRAGETTVMPDDLVDDYARAGFVELKRKPFVDKRKSNKTVIAIRHHQKKAKTLAKALEGGGYEVVDAAVHLGDALLIDHDIKEYGHQGYVKRFHKAGKPVFIYPHGAAPMLCWDGIHEPYEDISAMLVTSKGHREVMRRYGYPGGIPIHVIGWYLCPLKPWKPTKGTNVLFAPIHPILGHIFMFPEDLEVNRRTYERLLAVEGINLTVRHIGDLKVNGLWEAPGVRIYQGQTDNNYDEIDKADVVISNGTMAYMALARGKPVIMMNQLTPAREPDIKTHERLELVSIDKYEKYMRFPFDVDNDPDLGAIIRDACKREPKQWRKRFIGEQLEPDKFCELIGGLIG